MALPRIACLRWIAAVAAAVMLCGVAGTALADPASFDLNGPKVEVTVTRGGVTLPITEVPNLAVGDRLWIHPDFPPDQAVHYLLVAAFLNGATNTPPTKWFYKEETWNRKAAHKGLTITVPKGAEQVLLFLAPETSGDFKTLMGAVRGQPGAFVRASQDLNQASLDRTRLDTYLNAVRKTNATDPEKLKVVSPLLARSLDIKLNPDCLHKDMDEIAPCLTQQQDSLVLSDGHSRSIVDALTSGPEGDLALEAASTPQAGFGYYGSYVASAMDIARILNSFRTAQYQYIPALAEQKDGALYLKLNAPPSFHNPKSVLVVALPAVEPAQPPPLHPVDESQVYCAQNATLALPVEGAPLVFSTGYARNLTLHLEAANGKAVDLPLKPDALRGGLDVDTAPLKGEVIGSNVKASIRGLWGFTPFTGPVVHLQGAHDETWKIAGASDNALVVGRNDTLTLEADGASCVDGVELRGADGKSFKAAWKVVKPNQVQVTLPLTDAKPGAMTLLVRQSGLSKPQGVAVHAYSEAAHLSGFTIHAGDHEGVLAGTRLDEVASLALKGVVFNPGTLTSADGADTLQMEAVNVKAAGALKQGETAKAVAMLKDGRTEHVTVTVEAARPFVMLLSKGIESADGDGDVAAKSNIQLSNPDELPQDATLVFSLKAVTPTRFVRGEKIEVATDDGSYSTMLTPAHGLTLLDAQTAVARLVPAKAFGFSAFGPLEFRAVSASGVKGNWQPLATLVRLPAFESLKCGAVADAPCTLRGSNLFLVDAIANNAQFTVPTQVPDGFPGRVLPVSHPGANGQLYVKLRDDPSAVNVMTLVPQYPPAPKVATQKQYRPAYVSPSRVANAGAAMPAATGSPAAGSATAPAAPSAPSAAPAQKAPAAQKAPSTPPVPTSEPSGIEGEPMGGASQGAPTAG